MKQKQLQVRRTLQHFLITMMVLFLAGQPLSAQTKSSSGDTPTDKDRFEAPEPEKTTQSSSNTKTLMIVGGAAALGIVAVAAGSGGGGGSDNPEPENTSAATPATSSAAEAEEENIYTGPDLEGSNWHGYVNLVNHGNENVSITAKVSQDGNKIKISTSSTLPYARYFSGEISDNGYIKVVDQQTQKIWTSFDGAASSNHFRIYDYVNGNTDLDKLEVSR